MTRVPTCDRRGPRGKRCGAVLREIQDRTLGRITFVCEACERREAGRCAMCPRPVRGKRRRAEFCEGCYAKRQRELNRRWKKSWRREYRERVPAIPLAVAGHRAGLSRARNLSPERRSEIARLGGQARWARVRGTAA